MSETQEMDFRDQASEVSEKLVGGSSHVTAASYPTGVSLCVRQPAGDGSQKLHAYFGLGFVVVMIAMTMGSIFIGANGQHVIGGVGLAVFFCGLLIQSRVCQWLLRFLLSRRGNNLFSPYTGSSFAVSIEDPVTKDKAKVVTEDVALMTVDAQRQAIVLDGLRYHYVVCIKDLVDLIPSPNVGENGVILKYRIEDVELGLTLNYAGQGMIGALIGSFRSTYGTNKLMKIIKPQIKAFMGDVDTDVMPKAPTHPPTIQGRSI